jgi:hypothetical protein
MPDLPRFVGLSVRIYQWLMKVYPASFREKYGEEMAQVFQEVVTDSTRLHGIGGLAMTWYRVLGDLVCTVFQEHLIELQGELEMKTAPGWMAKLLALLSVACFWVVPFSPILAIAAVSTTTGSTNWPRKVAVVGAILCTLCTLLAAAMLLWLVCLSILNGSWAF